jgi:hypothetical protein
MSSVRRLGSARVRNPENMLLGVGMAPDLHCTCGGKLSIIA